MAKRKSCFSGKKNTFMEHFAYYDVDFNNEYALSGLELAVLYGLYDLFDQYRCPYVRTTTRYVATQCANGAKLWRTLRTITMRSLGLDGSSNARTVGKVPAALDRDSYISIYLHLLGRSEELRRFISRWTKHLGVYKKGKCTINLGYVKNVNRASTASTSRLVVDAIVDAYSAVDVHIHSTESSVGSNPFMNF